MSHAAQARQRLMDQLKTLLAGNLIDVDLGWADYDLAITMALDRYRQRSKSSVEESMMLLTLQTHQQIYTLPTEVIEVERIYRQGIGSNVDIDGGNQFDPFSLAFTNLYLLQPSVANGDLLTFEYYNQWLGTAEKMFGGCLDFRWNSRERKLFIIRNQEAPEQVLIKVYMEVPEAALIEARYSGPWIRSMALAWCKQMLGQAYEKVSALPGPNGSITLNGAQLKAESAAEMLDLEQQLKDYVDSSRGLGIVIG